MWLTILSISSDGTVVKVTWVDTRAGVGCTRDLACHNRDRSRGGGGKAAFLLIPLK